MARKRTRPTDDDSSDVEVEIANASSSFRQTAPSKRSRLEMAAANGGSVVSDDDDEMSLPSQDEDEDDGDEVDELAATQIVQNQIHSRRDNVAAEQGIIEEIYCSNFMCHSKLRIKPNANINFIIGHNGSGKSAVLTALTVCLGGKAAATNRASNLKSMIKEGQENAFLAVKIKNRGDGAYKPDLYGQSIAVERHFSRSGTSSFKMKNAEGKVISTKKADLEEIMDFFAFQLDNPINVLNQDAARQFLSSSSASEKYKLFIRGTQLEALDADYKLIEEHLDSIEANVNSRQEDIAVLDGEKDKAEQRLKRLEAASSIKEKIGETQRMHAWAQVEEQERDLKRKEQMVEATDTFVQERREEVDNISSVHEGHHQAWEQAKRNVEQLQGQIEPLKVEHETAKAAFDANKQELLGLKAQEREIKTNAKSQRDNIKRLELAIRQERRLLADEEGGEQGARLERLRELKEAVEQVRTEQKQHEDGYAELERERNEAQRNCGIAESMYKEKGQVLRDARTQLNGVERSEGGRLDAYDRRMSNLVRAIDNETRWRAKPLGPVGTHIRLLDMKWGPVIEKTFGGFLNGFICTNDGDRNLLKRIMDRVGFSTPYFITSQVDPIDCRHKEPDESTKTILRVLQIDNDLVRNTAIINHAIENTALADTSQAAIELVLNREHGVKAALGFDKHGNCVRIQGTRSGGTTNSPCAVWTGRPRMKADREEQIKALREAVNEAGRAEEAAKQQFNQDKRQLQATVQALNQFKKEKGVLVERVQRADDAVDGLQDEIESNRPQDGRLQELQNQLKENEDELAASERSLGDWVAAKEGLDRIAAERKAAMDAAADQFEVANARADKHEGKLQKCNTNREKALHSKNEALGKMQDAINERQAKQESVERQQATLEDFIAGAQQISPRVAVQGGITPQMLDDRLAKFARDYEHIQRTAGGSEEELKLAFAEAKRAWIEALSAVEENEKLAKTLKATLHERQTRWKKFRKYITYRARFTFQYLLSERQFRGRILMDHTSHLLDIKVEPDLTKASDAGRATKTLSGGEKSFSTICLLLSIWEAMGSPIRCLDEFDVFMDPVNRMTSMGMMIAAARRSVGRQFVFITPQAMGNVEFGADVRVHKMSDPERGQEILLF